MILRKWIILIKNKDNNIHKQRRKIYGKFKVEKDIINKIMQPLYSYIMYILFSLSFVARPTDQRTIIQRNLHKKESNIIINSNRE